MSDDADDDRYLWDGTGEPDPDVIRLEQVLGRLRHQGAPPALPTRTKRARLRFHARTLLALAASVILVLPSVWLITALRRNSWDVAYVAGAPVVAGNRITGTGRLAVGETLETDAGSRARLGVVHVGQVDVDPNTRVQLVQARSREHRFSLERGTIHARIWAPPRLFFVNTPAATAIDLGCAYTLHVDEDGSGLLRVTHGWVGFERDGREAFVPQGAMCATRAGVGPGTPRYDDAPSGYGTALTILDFERADDPRRADALALVLSQARRRDALTLWHLLTRGTEAERIQVYERLALVAPPPDGVTRALVLAGNSTAINSWWDSLGVDTGTWWRLLKKTLGGRSTVQLGQAASAR